MNAEGVDDAARRSASVSDALNAMREALRSANSKVTDTLETATSLPNDAQPARQQERIAEQTRQQRAVAARAAGLLARPELSVADCVRTVGLLRQCTRVFGPPGDSATGPLSLPLFFVEARMRAVAVEADALIASAAGNNARLFDAAAAVMAGPVLRLVSEFAACFLSDVKRDACGVSSASSANSRTKLVNEIRTAGRRHAECVLARFMSGRVSWFLRSAETLAGAAQTTAALATYWQRLVAMDAALARHGVSFFPLAAEVVVRRARALIEASGRATLASVSSRLHSLGQSSGASPSLARVSPESAAQIVPAATRDSAGQSVPGKETASLAISDAPHGSDSISTNTGKATVDSTSPPADCTHGDTTSPSPAIRMPTHMVNPSVSDAGEIAPPDEIRGTPLLVLVYNGVLAHDYFEQLRGLALPFVRDAAVVCTAALVAGLRGELAGHRLATPAMLAAYDASVAPLFVWAAECYYPSE